MTGRLALVALGSNQNSVWGDPTATLQRALAGLAALASGAVRGSAFYATPAFPAGTGPDFVNAAAAFCTDLGAQALLAALHGIEAEAGRTRARRWGQRTLDLDLLALGDLVWPDAAVQTAWRDLPLAQQAAQAPADLILPHPRLQDRGFVLVPLCDVAPGWQHPLLRQSVAQLCAALAPADRASVTRIG